MDLDELKVPVPVGNNKKIVRTRIAPSPTGEDIHIGNLYTALINWAYARQQSGQFIIRIEDTDRERFIEESEKRILSSLKKFNLEYNEGPDKDGPYGPYRQSERLDTYKKYAQELTQKDKAYICYCSKEKLEEIRKEEDSFKIRKRHIEYCHSPKSEKYVIRLKVPENKDIEFEDLIRGKIVINTSQVDDQVLIKSDGFPTYHLAVVVDDYLMKISHVIRAEEWISSTPKHILLYQAFGWELPTFVHLPILRNSDRSKLSKRKNPVWVSGYLQDGFLPEAILNFLALMGWAHPEGKEIFSVEEFVEKLNLKTISPVGPAFDIVKLEWLNGEYIRAMSDEELTDRLHDYLVGLEKGENEYTQKEKIAPLVPLVKERIKKLSDFVPMTAFLFEGSEYDVAVFDKLKINNLPEILEKIIQKLEELSKPWNQEEFADTFRKLAEVEGISNSQIFQLIRVAFSGQSITPPLLECMLYLGEEASIKRIKEAKEFIQKS